MKKLFVLIFVFFSLVGFSFTQTATINGVITDASGQIWANGTWTLAFRAAPSNPGPYVTNPGRQNFTQRYSGVLDSNGSMSQSGVQRNDYISPLLSTWLFTICPNASSNCFSSVISITSNNVSINSITPPGVIVNSLSLPTAYNDNELAATISGMYKNNTDNQIHYCAQYSNGSCTSWNNGGTFNSITSTSPSITPNSIESVLYADQFPGANCGARSVAAMEAVGYINFGAVTSPPDCGDSVLSTAWAPNASIAQGSYIFDTNGGLEEATTAGATGASPPASWPTTVGATTNDGTVVWTLQNANIYTISQRSYVTGTSLAPVTNHTFYTPNLGISLWDNSAAQNVNAISPSQNPGATPSPLDGNMAPVVKVVANESGSSAPTPFLGILRLNDASSGVASVAGGFAAIASPTDKHSGLWGVNENVTLQNPSFIPVVYGNEVNFANQSGVDANDPSANTSPTPYWGFGATGYGNAKGEAAFLAFSTASGNQWQDGLLINGGSVHTAGVQCGNYMAAFDTNATCVDAFAQGAPLYSGGVANNEASIPERDNAAVVTSATPTYGSSYVERQAVPVSGSGQINPRLCWSLAFNASPAASPSEQMCSDASGGNTAPFLLIGPTSAGTATNKTLVLASPIGAGTGIGFIINDFNEWRLGFINPSSSLCFDAVDDTYSTCAESLTTAGNVSFIGSAAWGGGAAIASSNNVVLNGADINTSNQVVSTHLSAPLAVAQGGTGLNSTAVFPASGTVAITSQLPLAGSVAGSTTVLAANSCGDAVTTTVTGATTSMSLSISPSNDPGLGLVWQGIVTGLNTVEVRYCNVTTVSITPAAVTFNIRVLQ